MTLLQRHPLINPMFRYPHRPCWGASSMFANTGKAWEGVALAPRSHGGTSTS